MQKSHLGKRATTGHPQTVTHRYPYPERAVTYENGTCERDIPGTKSVTSPDFDPILKLLKFTFEDAFVRTSVHHAMAIDASMDQAKL